MKKLPPFMGKETKSEERKEMKIKKISPKMYREGEKREGVHGPSGMEKPTKYAAGGKVAARMPKASAMGGMNLARGGGIETKGKTKAKLIKMAMGGSCK